MSDQNWHQRWIAGALPLVNQVLNAATEEQLELLWKQEFAARISYPQLISARRLLMSLADALFRGDAARFAELHVALMALEGSIEPQPTTVALQADEVAQALQKLPVAAIDCTLMSLDDSEGSASSDRVPDSVHDTLVDKKPRRASRPPVRVLLHETAASSDHADPPGTEEIPEQVQAKLQAAATPNLRLVPPLSVGTPKLDVEQYAVLCAWTEVQPEKRAELNRKHGIMSEAQRVQLDSDYGVALSRNSKLRQTFTQRLSLHIDFIRKTLGLE